MKVIFFGTPEIAATILDYLLQKQINVIAVVTKPDKKRGRDQQLSPPPVKILAQKYGLPVYQPLKARDPEFVQFLKSLNPDVFTVAAYSEIFNEELLKLPPKGCINVHVSLLPKYRGAAPIERCIMAGEKESGVTIMKMVKELDAGEMYAVAKTPIPEDMTAGELSEILSKLGAEALYHVLGQIEKNALKPVEQDHSQATYAHKITTADAEIRWDQDAQSVHNHIRGVTPKPGAFCYVEIQGEKKRLIIKKAMVAKEEENSSEKSCKILNLQKELVIGCRKGAIRLLKVQLEGKNLVSAEEFLRGYGSKNLKFL